ncbi:hypothetical protein VPH35_098099 [Triticum aestivum]
MIQKINLKLSIWTMSKVDVLLPCTCQPMWLRFFESHVENRDVRGPDGNINEECISFIMKTLGMDQSAAHKSSKLEEDCFQIAFVIFMTGHILEPSTEEIAQFNCCEHVLQCFLDAVTKLKIDLENGVFYLDNIDLGIFNMKHDVLPRVKEFDQDKLRRMTTMSTDVGVPEPSFRFINGNASISHLRNHTLTMSDRSAVCYSRSFCPSFPKTNTVNFPSRVVLTDGLPELPRQPSALDYSNNISSQPLAVLLQEQNARAFRHVTIACHNIQNDMVTFTDKLMSALAASCTCCTARGLIDCPLRSDTPANEKVHGVLGSAEASYRTLKAPKLTGVRLDLSDCEGNDQALTCNSIQQYARCIAEAVKDLYTDSSRDNQSCVFLLNWIVHRVLGLIRITGHDIVQQLIGAHMIDHEVGSILIRWHDQLDSEARLDTPYLTHLHLL